ncbi:hypothetical protein [Azospirillum endophyticum]
MIYGAGVAGRTLRHLLEREGIMVQAFIDSFRNGKEDDLPVFRVDEIDKYEIEKVVICSIYVNEIIAACRLRGLENIVDGYPLYVLHTRTGFRLRFPRS